MTRPSDSEYYEDRTDRSWLSQGDIFGMAVAYGEAIARLAAIPAETSLAIMRGEDQPTVAMETEAVAEDEPTFPRLVSHPLTPPALAMLITPTASMRVRGTSKYGHRFRSLVPIIPIDDLVATGGMSSGLTVRARTEDDLANVMYIPAHGPKVIPESMALLHSPITVSHEMLSGTSRLIQLQAPAVLQLQRQLIRLYAGDWPAADQRFAAPMD